MSIVKLNIGGVHFETSTATLSRYPDTMLARLIRQPTEMELIKNGGELFIDRDGTMFAYILNYLRHGDQTVLPTDDPTRMISLKQEADFYGLPGLVELMKRGAVFKVGDSVRFRESDKFIKYVQKILSPEVQKLRDLRCEVCHEVAEIGPRDELGNYALETCIRCNPLGRIEEIGGDCARVIYTFGSMKEAFKHPVSEEVFEQLYLELLDDEDMNLPIVKDFMVNMHIPLKYLKVDD